MTEDTTSLAPTDAEILALNRLVEHFSETPSKYPEAGHGTQYHAGAPGVLSFARAVLAKWGAPAPASGDVRSAAQALVDRWDTPKWKDAEHTGAFIQRLREALAAPPAQEVRVSCTLSSCIAELAEQHGSLRAAARSIDCDPGYLARLQSGEKSNPSPALLERLGLRQVITYERGTT